MYFKLLNISITADVFQVLSSRLVDISAFDCKFGCLGATTSMSKYKSQIGQTGNHSNRPDLAQIVSAINSCQWVDGRCVRMAHKLIQSMSERNCYFTSECGRKLPAVSILSLIDVYVGRVGRAVMGLQSSAISHQPSAHRALILRLFVAHKLGLN